MKYGRQVVTSGLRVKAVWAGEYTSLLIQGPGGQIIFRGAIIFSMWSKIKEALDSLVGADYGNQTNLDEISDA